MSEGLEFHVSDLVSYRNHVQINALLATLANAFGLYLVICKSPQSIGVYRWFLLDIVVDTLIIFRP